MSLITTIEEFKLKYADSIRVIEDNKLSEDVLEYYINNYDKVKWTDISIYQTLSEQFMDKYYDKVNWFYTSEFQTLSEEFIARYNDRVDWWHISMYQTLSEEFIAKYKDKVYWRCISKTQSISEGFIGKYYDKVSWNRLLNNDNINLSYDFLFEHLYDFNLYEVWVGIEYSKETINKLVEEFPDKYRLDKLAYELNN